MRKLTVDDIRKQYIITPPKGYTSKEIVKMSDKYILDFYYFNKETIFPNIPTEIGKFTFKCPGCGALKRIPSDVVNFFNINTPRTQDTTSTFYCTNCSKKMVPQYSSRIYGTIFKRQR